MSRKELEKCLGLLCWFTNVSPSLRCWLRELLCVLHKPAVVLRHLDADQLRELQRLLTSSGQVQSAISSPAISAGWQVLEVDHQEWSAGVDLQQHAGTLGSAWVKFGDSDSKIVRVSPQAASAARFYCDLLRLKVAVHLVETTGPRFVAAADAFADGRKANFRWFSYAITAEELPEWFVGSQGMESVICALEALAQLIF